METVPSLGGHVHRSKSPKDPPKDPIETPSGFRDLYGPGKRDFNSHERDLDQWNALLLAADEGLRLRQVIAPFGSAMSLLEVEMVGATQEESPEKDIWEISG
ncbi:hypothetical protein ANO14919_079740 [Xylariales sp. No.14919]|nr:hypothetical protein ANO14919_079740 [Xylariales sp. No.14919]